MLEVFYSCSNSNQDQTLLKKLKTQLAPLKREGAIGDWNRQEDIEAGKETQNEIESHLNSADIILLLISPDFLSDESCRQEVKRAMERHVAEDSRVIPIILRPCDWWDEPFGKLQPLPQNGQPITKWKDEDDVFLAIAQGIRGIRKTAMNRSHETPDEKSSDKIAPQPSVYELMSQAFPFQGRTRVIYTCRSLYAKDPKGNPQPFNCPTLYPDQANPNLLKSINTIISHVSMDELETLGLSFVWYGSEILGNQEALGKSDIYCSEIAYKDLQIIVKHLSEDEASRKPDIKENEEISERLTDNLIVIGENRFSNYLFPLINHQIPWRYKPLKDKEICSSSYPVKPPHHYSVQLYFNDCFTNQIEPHIFYQLKDTDSEYNWGIITFIPNPFAENRWILFLLGCSRPGQYLLLSWLRSQEAITTLKEIINCRESRENRCKFLQVIVRGKSKGNNRHGEICRQWERDTIKNIYNGTKTSFFTNTLTYPTNDSNKGDTIADISLLAKISPDCEWIKLIQSTLPNSLENLFEEEKNNGEIGFHTTLYEFLHTKGFDDHGFVNHAISQNKEFITKLKENFAQLPPSLSLIARQTRITQQSLQVLVDIYASCEVLAEVQEDLKKREPWREYPGAKMLFSNCCATAMDLVFNFCRDASQVLCSLDGEKYSKKKYKEIFNINSIPQPLHCTILRFPKELSAEQRGDAEQWVNTYKNRIWGKGENLPIVLTRAFEYPFQDIRQVPL